MRELNAGELSLVAGGGGEGDAGNSYGGVSGDSGGPDLSNIYEGLVEFTSHVIERVANAL